MLIVAFICCGVGLYCMVRWLYYTPIVWTRQRVAVALAADCTTMLMFGIILYGLGVHLSFQ